MSNIAELSALAVGETLTDNTPPCANGTGGNRYQSGLGFVPVTAIVIVKKVACGSVNQQPRGRRRDQIPFTLRKAGDQHTLVGGFDVEHGGIVRSTSVGADRYLCLSIRSKAEEQNKHTNRIFHGKEHIICLIL